MNLNFVVNIYILLSDLKIIREIPIKNESVSLIVHRKR